MAACCGVPPYTPDQLMEIVVTDTTVSARLGPALARPRRLSPPEGFALAAAARALVAIRQRRGRSAVARPGEAGAGPRGRGSGCRARQPAPPAPGAGGGGGRGAGHGHLLLGVDRSGHRPGHPPAPGLCRGGSLVRRRLLRYRRRRAPLPCRPHLGGPASTCRRWLPAVGSGHRRSRRPERHEGGRGRHRTPTGRTGVRRFRPGPRQPPGTAAPRAGVELGSSSRSPPPVRRSRSPAASRSRCTWAARPGSSDCCSGSGPGARVVDPPEDRELARDAARRILRRYGSPGDPAAR